MNMFEEALALSGMLKMRGMTQSEIAKKLGVSQSYVANKIRLLRLPDRVREKILDGGICERQARQLLRLDTERVMLDALEKISRGRMTVAESEAVIDMLVEHEAPKRLLRGEIRERLSSFENFIDRSLMSLSSCGIKAEKISETHNEKRYITIAITEK